MPMGLCPLSLQVPPSFDLSHSLARIQRVCLTGAECGDWVVQIIPRPCGAGESSPQTRLVAAVCDPPSPPQQRPCLC